MELESYFDGRLFRNKVWVGTVEGQEWSFCCLPNFFRVLLWIWFGYAGLPVYFIEPHHPSKFFWRGTFYGEHDDFKRFSYFSRAALELLLQAGKKPDIIHCHDWQTAFVVWAIHNFIIDFELSLWNFFFISTHFLCSFLGTSLLGLICSKRIKFS